jgi:hypothetical protein
MKAKYSKAQLNQIREQSIVYQCACPAQVSTLMSEMRSLYEYQERCLNDSDVDVEVHRNIAAATSAAYLVIEQCLTDVLILEGWDLETLEMPERLRQKLLKQINEE